MKKQLKVLNLYAGAGGNRKLWKNVEVTAIELNPKIAKIYTDHFPEDTMIITDAHQYLLDHLKDDWDFIWSSPPCQSHSKMRKNVSVGRGQVEPIYPDMRLYQEIILLQHHFKGKWVVENVIGYYMPLIRPQNTGGHYFWANFIIPKVKAKKRFVEYSSIKKGQDRTGFDLTNYNLGKRIDQVYHNCLDSELGNLILQSAFKIKQTTITNNK